MKGVPVYLYDAASNMSLASHDPMSASTVMGLWMDNATCRMISGLV